MRQAQFEYLRIPDLLATWPCQRRLNPLQEVVAVEGRAWLHSLRPFNPKSQYAFDKCNFDLCSALLLPCGSRDHLRVSLNLLYLFFVIDEYTDVEPAGTVYEMIEICRDALNHPEKHRPAGEIVIGELARQFWVHVLKTVTPQGAKHLLITFMDYLESVVREAEARDRATPLTIAEYWAIRLEGTGARSLYSLGGLHLSLPDDALFHPMVSQLTYIGCELIGIDNDILSYNREQASGIDHFNIVMVVMHQYALDRAGAIEWLSNRCKELEARYLKILATMPSFGPEVDELLREYLEHMGNTRRAVWCWSLECGRYFGERGTEFAAAQKVPLIPRKERRVDLHREQIEIMLMQEELERL